MKHANRLIALFLAAGLGFSAAARADIVPQTQPARRTLFVAAWNTTLKLQAPEGMCFVDRTMAAQTEDWNRLRKVAGRTHDQILLAAFMRCNQIDGTGNWEKGAPDYGIVTWLDPAIGATTKMSRRDYLDMREASFRAYAGTRFPHLTAPPAAHRTADDVSVVLTGMEPGPGGDPGIANPSAVVIATTLLRHVPVEFTLHYAGAHAPDAAALSNMADTLAKQLILLNP
ncbi:MAG: hypothetical protein KGL10_04350 [Alphaproteobacteria bacterium]|nr:hypothetical protein [Alphaproteobacteria bacterium]